MKIYKKNDVTVAEFPPHKRTIKVHGSEYVHFVNQTYHLPLPRIILIHSRRLHYDHKLQQAVERDCYQGFAIDEPLTLKTKFSFLPLLNVNNNYICMGDIECADAMDFFNVFWNSGFTYNYVSNLIYFLAENKFIPDIAHNSYNEVLDGLKNWELSNKPLILPKVNFVNYTLNGFVHSEKWTEADLKPLGTH